MMEKRIVKEIINFEIMKVVPTFLEMMVQKMKLEGSPSFAGIVEVRITWIIFF